jgi:hypothetical protein
MTPRQDPFRVLGLVPGATAGEIRSAYRRLAKLNHPDTAGERSLPRFLAIKSAYEELVDAEGRLRSRFWPGRDGGAGAWRASGTPANQASREAWRARRAGGSAGAPGSTSAGSSSTSAGASASSAGASGSGKRQPGADGRTSGPGPKARTGSKSGSGSRSAADRGSKSGPSARSGGRPTSADRRTARPGSTTYDEAAQPLDPSWEGGSWYGASSGSYWTLNPREYADPRKHGPEYQERAKRAAQLEAARRAGTLPPEDGTPGGPSPSSGSSREPPPSPGAPRSASSASAPSSRDSRPDVPPRHGRPVRRPTGPGAP